MAVMNKPDYKIFAGSAKAGEVVTFPNVDRGWGITLDSTGGIPPMEFYNGLGKRQDEWLLYLTQQGIPEWAGVVDYPVNSIIKQGSVLYIALRANKDKQPSSSQSDWKKFTDYLGVDNKIDKSAVKQSTGNSTTDLMSQKSITDELNKKFDKAGGDLLGDLFVSTTRKPMIGIKHATNKHSMAFESQDAILPLNLTALNQAGAIRYSVTFPEKSGTLMLVGEYGLGGNGILLNNAGLRDTSIGSNFYWQGGGENSNEFGSYGCGVNINYSSDRMHGLFINGSGGVIATATSKSSGNYTKNSLLGSINTTTDNNGFIKKSSPIINIHPDGSYTTNDESEGATVARCDTGHYLINGIRGYNADGAWGVNGGISAPKDNNGLELIYIDDRVNEDGSIIIETFHRQHSHLPTRFQNWRLKSITEQGDRLFYHDGEPCDLPEGTRLDVRVEMPEGSVWNVKQKEIEAHEVKLSEE